MQKGEQKLHRDILGAGQRRGKIRTVKINPDGSFNEENSLRCFPATNTERGKSVCGAVKMEQKSEN